MSERNGIPVPDAVCTTCGYPTGGHHPDLWYGDPPRRCLEARHHGDTVVDAVMHLVPGFPKQLEQPRFPTPSARLRAWKDELLANGLPPMVPAARWEADINRYLHAKGYIEDLGLRLADEHLTHTSLTAVVTTALKKQPR